MNKRVVTILLGLAAYPGLALAEDASDVIVVTAPGGGMDADDAVALDAAAMGRDAPPRLLDALSAQVAGVSLSNAQGNPYQPDLVYRGFSASPLQGNAQGLAIYVDGVRFNQPFGDTVNFDLLPEGAIAGVTVKDVSPVYGLNALGGSIIVATKTGKSHPGVSLYAAGGDHGVAEGGVEAGYSKDAFSAFLALEERHDGGWRDWSPSRVYRGFGDIGWDGEGAGLHIKYNGAGTKLTGNGSAPIELLGADYGAVFTHPDRTRNAYHRVSLHPWLQLNETMRLEASLYAQQLHQRTLNGDNADVAGCADAANLLCLGDAEDGEQVLLRDADGASIVDMLGGEGYGLLNRSQTRTRALGALVQLVDERRMLGANHRMVLGVSHDRGRTRFNSHSELGELTETRGVSGLGPIITQPDGSIAPVSLTTRTRYSGVFLSDELEIGERLRVELGLRWNGARVLLDDRIGTALNGRHRFRRLNPGIEVDYRFSPGFGLRAGYAEANRAPTPAELSCADETAPCSLTNFFVGDPPLRQVVARSWEAGASGRLEGALKVDWLLSAYRTTSRNDIQFVASATRGRAFFQNVGVTRRQGLEMSIGLEQGHWRLQAGYALSDATFRSPLTFNSPDNPSADDGGVIEVRPGDRLPGVPRHRVVLSLGYEQERFSVDADVQAQSGQYLRGDEGNDQPRTGGFAIVNLRGSMQLTGPIRLFAKVSNLFDRRHATFGTFGETSSIELDEAPGATDPRSLTPGAPRRWLAGVRIRL